MGGGLKTLERLAAVSSLSEFCRVAEKKSLMDELILVQDDSMIYFLQRQDFTTVLTAALVRGLELLVSSSVGSGASTSTSANTSRATAHAKQHQSGGTTSQGGHLGSSTLHLGQHIPPLTAAMQDSYQHLRAVTISLIRWYTILKNCKDEHNRMNTGLLTPGLLGIVPDALYCTAAHAEQVRQQLEQQAQQQRSSSALQKAAQPLNEMLVLSATLLELQAECYRKPHFLFPNETSTAAIKSAFRSASSLTGASAAMTAIWHCERVLQACLGAATGQFKMGKYKPKARLLETTAMCAADLVSHCSKVVEASQSQPEKAAVAAAVAAVSLDAMLEVVLGFTAHSVTFKHKDQQGKPSAPLPDGVLSSVPPSHEALLQAVGLLNSLPTGGVPVIVSRLDVVAECFPVLDWALQQLCERLRDEAASSQHTPSCSSSGAAGSSSCTGTGAGRSNVSTAPGSRAGNPHVVYTANKHSAASFHSMRLLPLLPALLAELVGLQPKSDVLSSVLTTSALCLRIGQQLQEAARAQQASRLGSCTVSAGSAILQGLFRACLEVFVPVQQHLAVSSCGSGDGSGSSSDAAAVDATSGSASLVLILEWCSTAHMPSGWVFLYSVCWPPVWLRSTSNMKRRLPGCQAACVLTQPSAGLRQDPDQLWQSTVCCTAHPLLLQRAQLLLLGQAF